MALFERVKISYKMRPNTELKEWQHKDTQKSGISFYFVADLIMPLFKNKTKAFAIMLCFEGRCFKMKNSICRRIHISITEDPRGKKECAACIPSARCLLL